MLLSIILSSDAHFAHEPPHTALDLPLLAAMAAFNGTSCSSGIGSPLCFHWTT